MPLYYADRSKCLSVHSLLTLCDAVLVRLYSCFLLWKQTSHCFKVTLSQNASLTTRLWFQSATSMGKGMNPITGVVLIDAGLSCCVLAEKCFPNKGIIIPTYFCVSCSPDIQRVVMEIKHGPQGQGKLGLFTVLSASPPL